MPEIGYRHDPSPDIYDDSYVRAERCATCRYAHPRDSRFWCVHDDLHEHFCAALDHCDNWAPVPSPAASGPAKVHPSATSFPA